MGEAVTRKGEIFMRYLGIDVAKAKLDCCLLVDLEKLKYKSKSVANSPEGIDDLLAWIKKQNITLPDVHIVMEATGIYHELAAQRLYDAGVIVSVANPAQVKHFGQSLGIRTKTDGVDSQVLARYGAQHKLRHWVPSPPEARILKDLLARREAIEQDLQREKNRQEKTSVAQSSTLIQQSLDDSIYFLTAQLKKIQSQINDHIDQYPSFKKDIKLMQSIPGVGQKTSTNLLCILHANNFLTAEQLAAYLGVIPVEYQSGSSIKGRPKLSKAGPSRVRGVLYMASVSAIKHNPHVKALYERLQARGKCKMSALGAAMRKLVHLCFGVVKTQKMYQAEYQNA
jgi:transposase